MLVRLFIHYRCCPFGWEDDGDTTVIEDLRQVQRAITLPGQAILSHGRFLMLGCPSESHNYPTAGHITD